jgi:pimeloyl-ACP methyl ester carboxylesterase
MPGPVSKCAAKGGSRSLSSLLLLRQMADIAFFGICMKKPTMDKKSKRSSCALVLLSWLLLCAGCSYLVKNDRELVYSNAQYGADKFVVVSDRHIHYVEAGEGQPLLLIPGAFSTYRDWNRITPFLARQYRVLAIDYLGVGDSDKPRSGTGYTIEAQADLLVKMMDTLRISKADIVGVSYGGGIALNIAARYRDRVGKIICIEGNGLKNEKLPYRPMEALLRWPVISDAAIGLIRSGLIDGVVVRLVMGTAWHELSEEGRKEVSGIISQNNKTASRFSWYHISRSMKTSKDFTEEVKSVELPILYLYGKKSGYRYMAETNAEFLKKHLSDVTIISFEDGIHDLELQKPATVADLIVEFLSGRKGGDPLMGALSRGCGER